MTQTRRQFVFQSAATLAAAGFLPARAWAAETPVEAETAFGRMRGVDVDGIKTFKGIPYGASTAGRNRFMPPVDPAKWTGVRDALAYGPERAAARAGHGAATALGSRPWPAPACATESEDCLVLNVWTPALERQPQAAGDGLVPRRRLRHRLRLVAGHRGRGPGAPRRRGGGDAQPPPQRAGLHLPRGGGRRRVRAVRRRRHARHRARAEVGARQHRAASAATRAT